MFYLIIRKNQTKDSGWHENIENQEIANTACFIFVVLLVLSQRKFFFFFCFRLELHEVCSLQKKGNGLWHTVYFATHACMALLRVIWTAGMKIEMATFMIMFLQLSVLNISF